MNGLRLLLRRSALKPGLVLCALVSWLLALSSPALAIAIYDAFVDVSVSAPGPIPAGTGISLFTGSTFTPPPVEIGSAIAVNAASASPPGTALASASGSASAPPDSLAQSLATATSLGALLNQNAIAVGFPLTIAHSSILDALSTGPNDSAGSHISFQVLLDGAILASDNAGCIVGPGPGSCTRTDTGSTPLVVPLTPGFHALLITAEADGFATATTVVPEPTSLFLFGTTMAGLGLASRWRWRRQK